MRPSQLRRWIQSEEGDTLASIAARELLDLPAADSLRTLQSCHAVGVEQVLVNGAVAYSGAGGYADSRSGAIVS